MIVRVAGREGGGAEEEKRKNYNDLHQMYATLLMYI
jgi:hypothetical protein